LISGSLRYARTAKSPSQAKWVEWALTGIAIDWGFYGMFNVMHENTWFWLVMGLAMAWVSRSAFDRSTAVRAMPEATAGQAKVKLPVYPALDSEQ
jgi:hypothetical protein